MTDSGKRKLSAKQILSDIRSGMDAAALKGKYRLSDKSLETVCRKLLEAGALKEHERPLPGPLPIPPRRSREEPRSAEWQCPACGRPQESAVPECPVCGVVVAKYIARERQDHSIPDASRTFPLNAGLSQGNNWTSVAVSIVLFAIIGGAILIWAGQGVPEKPEMPALVLRAQRSHNVQSKIDRPDENTVDQQTSTIKYPEDRIGDPAGPSAALSPMIPLPQEPASEKTSPIVEKISPPVETASTPPRSTKYVTGVLRRFHSGDFKTEVVEASKTYPVLFQFYSDT